ncbi:MAG: polysaccharide pyruvyl transferase family protein [Polyangiales bacterium]
MHPSRDSGVVPLFWWEGFYDVRTLVRRLVRGDSPRVRNFGDQLSPFVVSLLSGARPVRQGGCEKLLAIGSIFFALKDRDTVWGSGLLDEGHVRFARRTRDVIYRAVRGPRTREALIRNDLDCPAVYGDPALLLPQLVTNDVAKKYRVGVCPHFSRRAAFQSVVTESQFKLLNAEAPFAEAVTELLQCEVVLASSLHGVIVAEAYGIPALWVQTGVRGPERFKFDDYFASTDREAECARLEHSSQIAALAEQAARSPLPKIDVEPLRKAFPYPRRDGPPPLGWSELVAKSRRGEPLYAGHRARPALF